VRFAIDMLSTMHDRARSGSRLRRAFAIILAGTSLAGCVSKTESTRQHGLLVSPNAKTREVHRASAAPSPSARTAHDAPVSAAANSPGMMFSRSVRTVLLPLGFLPYDGFVLPLLSPDGRHAATQVGDVEPDALPLAEPEALPPEADGLRTGFDRAFLPFDVGPEGFTQARLKDLAATTVIAEVLASVPVELSPTAARA